MVNTPPTWPVSVKGVAVAGGRVAASNRAAMAW
jgi:hypothetical protein